VISEEGNARIDVLTVKNKQIVYHYGHYGQQGAGKNYLSDPSNALEEGSEIVIGDVRNCRIVLVKPPHHSVRQEHRPDRRLQARAAARAGQPGERVPDEQRRHGHHGDRRRAR